MQFYTTAINQNYKPELHVHYSNRSAAYIKLGKFDLALEDGERAILVRPDWAKGYFRKGCALQALRRPAEAVQAYQHGLAVDPSNAGLKTALKSAVDAQREATEEYQEQSESELHRASKCGDR